MHDRKLTRSLFTESILLQNSALSVSEHLVDELKQLIKNEKISKNFCINGCYTDQTFEISSKNGKTKNKKEILFYDNGVLSMLEEIGGIDIDITITNGEIFDIDGEYAFDPKNNDSGEIVILMKIPKNRLIDENELSSMIKKLHGHVAHELQHARQRLLYRRKLKMTATTSVEKHILDIDEIDARIEEILVMINSYDNMTKEIFENELNNYIDVYLKRNSITNISVFNLLQDKMKRSHMRAFTKKYCKEA